jgi:UDP-2-acetamido-2-deoxy-ribo-hexuluronate aminotransferase
MQFIDLKQQYSLIEEQVKQRLHAVLAHGQYIMGPEVAELEGELAQYTGAEYAIAVSSGTDALLLALMALDVGPGDEVITTPFSFIATAEVIALLGATPVFVDIDAETYNIDPALLEVAITQKTKAIMPVSLYGQCADFTRINAIAAKHKLPVIEDGAQSFGATHHGKQSCNLSTIGCTSFFPSKPLGAYGDAGACFTNDEQLATRMQQLRVHGQDRRYHHPYVGINGRIDTMQAAVLLAKLPLFSQEVPKRELIGSTYNELLAGKVKTQTTAAKNTHVYAQYTIEVDARDQVQAALKAQGIPTAVHYPIPLYLQPAFSYLGLGNGHCPRAERAAARVMSLPMHPYLTQTQQQSIVAALLEIIK